MLFFYISLRDWSSTSLTKMSQSSMLTNIPRGHSTKKDKKLHCTCFLICSYLLQNIKEYMHVDSNTHIFHECPHSLVQIFNCLVPKLLDEFWCMHAVRMLAVSFPCSYGFAVSIAAVYVTSYSLNSVLEVLRSCHEVAILILATNHLETGNSFLIFTWLTILRVS